MAGRPGTHDWRDPPRNVAGRRVISQNVAGRKLIKPLSLLGCCGFAATKNKCCGSRPQKSPMFSRVVAVLRVQRGREAGAWSVRAWSVKKEKSADPGFGLRVSAFRPGFGRLHLIALKCVKKGGGRGRRRRKGRRRTSSKSQTAISGKDSTGWRRQWIARRGRTRPRSNQGRARCLLRSSRNAVSPGHEPSPFRVRWTFPSSSW
jgi:hypothetical protein